MPNPLGHYLEIPRPKLWLSFIIGVSNSLPEIIWRVEIILREKVRGP